MRNVVTATCFVRITHQLLLVTYYYWYHTNWYWHGLVKQLRCSDRYWYRVMDLRLLIHKLDLDQRL